MIKFVDLIGKLRPERVIAAAAAAVIAAGVLIASCRVPSGVTEAPADDSTPLPAQTDGPVTAVPGVTPEGGASALLSGEMEPGAKTVSTTLYFITDEGYVLPVDVKLPFEAGIAKACLARLTAGGEYAAELKKLGLTAPIPEGTEIRIAIADGEAKVDLRNMPALADYRQEQNLFIAIVDTLTQFDTVDTVSVYINGSNAPTANGSELPSGSGRLALNVEDDAVAVSGNAQPVTLYFPNSSGALFVPVTRYLNGSGLTGAIGALVSGTAMPGLLSCFPENTLVLGAAIENGLLTVNLSKDFEAVAETPGLYSLAMQAVMLTAMPYGSVDEIRFTVNGVPFAPPGED